MLEILNILRQQQIPTETPLDEDVEAFVTAAGISDETEIDALQYLVTELKAESLWDNYIALYPIVGGTATTHKFNLKDPQDTNGAFRLTFSGTITHDATGMQGNGSNGVANTYVIPNTHLSLNDNHIAFYSNTSGAIDDAEMGVADWGAEPGLFINMRATDGEDYSINNITGYPSRAWATDTGLYVNNRTSSANYKLLRNGTITTYTATSTTRNNEPIYILGLNSPNLPNYSSRKCQFASVGTGFSDAELATFETIVETYQTMLGR